MAKYSKRDYKMFKKLKKLFRKKEIITSGITIYMDKDGETFVDIKMLDESERSIEHLSSLLTMFNPANMIQVTSVLRHQCKINKKDQLYADIIGQVVEKIGVENFTQDEKDIPDEPCINPSDMI